MKSGDIKIPRLKFKEEHERLLNVLTHPTKINLKKEVNIQRKELLKELHPKLDVKEIKKEVKKRKGKKEVEVFDVSRLKKNKNKK